MSILTRQRIKNKANIVSKNSAIILSLLLATILRLWGIGFGLPLTNAKHGELFIVNATMKFGSGDINPHFFNYPPLYLYVLFLVFILYYFINVVFGQANSPIAFATQAALDPTPFLLLGRLLSAVSGLATVWIVYKTAAWLFNKQIGLVTAILTGSSYLLVWEAHFGRIDTFGTMMIVLAFLHILKLTYHSHISAYMQTGLLIGLAISAKYIALILVVPLLITHLFSAYSQKNIKKAENKKLLLAGLGIPAGFALGSPFALLDFDSFVKGLKTLWEISHQPWYGIQTSSGHLYHLFVTLPLGASWPLYLLALIGIAWLVKIDLRKGILLISFPAVAFLILGSSSIIMFRNMVPIVPFLCIFAAFALNQIAIFFNKRPEQKVLFISTLILITPNLYNSIQLDKLLATKDSRLLAAEYIHSYASPDSSVFHVGTWLGAIKLPPGRMMLEYETAQLKKTDLPYWRQVITANSRSHNYTGFNEWQLEQQRGFTFKGEKQTTSPDYIIRYETPLFVDKNTSPVTTKIVQSLSQSYTLIQSIIAYDSKNKNRIWDHQEAFYLPFAGFTGITRPGPNIFIYEKK